MLKSNGHIEVSVSVLTDERSRYPVANPEGKAKMYVWDVRDPAFDHPPYADNSEESEKDWKQYERESVRLRREVGYEALKLIGADDDLKLRWNRKLGCSCGCSPGFAVEGGKGLSISVTVLDERRYADATDEELRYYERSLNARLAKGRGYMMFESDAFGADEVADPQGDLRELGPFDYWSGRLAEIEAEIERRS